MITPADLRVYVTNLRRRPDRRAWITRAPPRELPVTFTSDWTGPFDGHDLTRNQLEAAGYTLFSCQIESENPWWSRPLKYGEVACTLSHLACWRHAARAGDEPFIVILEDDAILPATFLDELLAGLRQLAQHSPFDLLYLGRFPLEPGHDQPALDGFVTPAYSHCTFGYLLTRPAIDLLLATHLGRANVPVDEFLPLFLYIDHPRPDLRTRFPRQLTALAFDPPLVRQCPKDDAGSDTEDSDSSSLPHVRLGQRLPVADEALQPPSLPLRGWSVDVHTRHDMFGRNVRGHHCAGGDVASRTDPDPAHDPRPVPAPESASITGGSSSTSHQPSCGRVYSCASSPVTVERSPMVVPHKHIRLRMHPRRS